MNGEILGIFWSQSQQDLLIGCEGKKIAELRTTSPNHKDESHCSKPGQEEEGPKETFSPLMLHSKEQRPGLKAQTQWKEGNEQRPGLKAQTQWKEGNAN